MTEERSNCDSSLDGESLHQVTLHQAAACQRQGSGIAHLRRVVNRAWLFRCWKLRHAVTVHGARTSHSSRSLDCLGDRRPPIISSPRRAPRDRPRHLTAQQVRSVAAGSAGPTCECCATSCTGGNRGGGPDSARRSPSRGRPSNTALVSSVFLCDTNFAIASVSQLSIS